jgi:hypothetical protein
MVADTDGCPPTANGLSQDMGRNPEAVCEAITAMG